MMKSTFLFLISLLSLPAAFAADPAAVLSVDRLPDCVESQGLMENYPRWTIQNNCGVPIEIVWCWKDAPADWKNAANVCGKTGHRSSGAIQPGAHYEFPDRPYLDNKFKPSAMLSVVRVCNASQPQGCDK